MAVDSWDRYEQPPRWGLSDRRSPSAFLGPRTGAGPERQRPSTSNCSALLVTQSNINCRGEMPATTTLHRGYLVSFLLDLFGHASLVFLLLVLLYGNVGIYVSKGVMICR